MRPSCRSSTGTDNLKPLHRTLRASRVLLPVLLASVPDIAALHAQAAKPHIPQEITGSWRVTVAKQTSKLKADHTIEIKIGDDRKFMPDAVLSYFVGDSERPSTICRSQLTLFAVEGEELIFQESMNYKGGKDACPIWDQVAITPRGGQLWVRWRDGNRRKPTIKIEAAAFRATGGQECRVVSGDGRAGGQEWCRDAEGNWAPKRRT